MLIDIQSLVFKNISLLSVADPTFDRVRLIPICREFSLNDAYRNIYLDVLAITETGKLVLIECKLWKNPQARREVIAQLIEYASLMRRLSYSDLTAYLKKYVPADDNDPIPSCFRKNNISFVEAELVDRVSASLKRGDFHLIIAGDGIRSDVQGIAEVLNAAPAFGGNLALDELALFIDADRTVMVTPRLPFATETVTKTVYLSNSGDVVRVAETEEPELEADLISRKFDPETLRDNAEFWTQFIATMKFDHPEQSPPRKGGTNWIKVDFPAPFKYIAGYRTVRTHGAWADTVGENDEAFFQFLNDRLEHLRAMLGPEMKLELRGDTRRVHLYCFRDNPTLPPEQKAAEQAKYIAAKLNAFVNTLRPLISEFNSLS